MSDSITARRVQLAAQRAILLHYMRAKMEDEDFHGVCDAANDLRELDAELRGLGWHA